MSAISRKEAVGMIVDDIMSNLNDENLGEINDCLMYGCEGWINQTSTELERELFERFDIKYTIV